MKHKINPLVDCVFKAILGSEENKNLLIHFLNAVLEPDKEEQIVDVTIKNPYNEREFASDKLSVVDVKATDQKGKTYQIEVQIATHAGIKARILYTWSSIYHGQIKEGNEYSKLKPVISIWIINQNLFPKIESCHLPFSVYNIENKTELTDHLAIHVIQLQKWKQKKSIKKEKDRWIYLFREGKNTDPEKPPKILNTIEMRQVMQVLNRFSKNEKNYLLYQSRLDAIMKENTIISARDEAVKEKEKALKREGKAVKEKEKAVKEKIKAEKRLNSLMALLKKKGIEIPDE